MMLSRLKRLPVVATVATVTLGFGLGHELGAENASLSQGPATFVAQRHASATGPVREAAERAWVGPEGAPLPFSGHAAAEAYLRTATVIASEEVRGSQNRPLKLLLERDGVRAHAIFRRVDRIWRRESIGGRWRSHLVDRGRSERAAYVVGRMLGLDNIPPTVLRELDGERGSLQLWLEEARGFDELLAAREEAPPGWVEQMTAVRLFDALILNVDRHPANYLMDADGSLWMIDHTQAFQYRDEIPDIELLRTIRRGVWERLGAIQDAEFRAALEESLNDTQIDAFLDRRRQLVTHFEALIEAEGEANVLRRR